VDLSLRAEVGVTKLGQALPETVESADSLALEDIAKVLWP